MKKIFLIVGCLIMCFALCSCGAEKIAWDNIVLGNMLPEPPANKGEIHTNSADELWLDINKISVKQFVDYIEACKEKGFSIDSESDSSSYDAYNTEGYKLSLSYYGSNSNLEIQLEVPMEMTNITWPTSTAGMKLPAPQSTTGNFSYEHDDSFFVYIGNTTKSDYAEYVKTCSNKGFNVDFNKGDDYYYADNSEGWHISIRYEGNNIMSIDIDAPSEEENSDKSSSATEEKSNKDTLSSDFKTAMDSYEKFMDEYVAFMKKYKANPSDHSILADYTGYMSKYADFVKNFEKWENEEMNTAEAAYYIEVQARVSKKLLEVAS